MKSWSNRGKMWLYVWTWTWCVCVCVFSWFVDWLWLYSSAQSGWQTIVYVLCVFVCVYTIQYVIGIDINQEKRVYPLPNQAFCRLFRIMKHVQRLTQHFHIFTDFHPHYHIKVSECMLNMAWTHWQNHPFSWTDYSDVRVFSRQTRNKQTNANK